MSEYIPKVGDLVIVLVDRPYGACIFKNDRAAIQTVSENGRDITLVVPGHIGVGWALDSDQVRPVTKLEIALLNLKSDEER